MKTATKSVAKQRPITIGALAAKVLGHTRVMAEKTLSTRQLTAAFPAFNAMELAYAMSELTDKQLVTQKGSDDHATYSLTDRGRLSRIAVS